MFTIKDRVGKSHPVHIAADCLVCKDCKLIEESELDNLEEGVGMSGLYKSLKV